MNDKRKQLKELASELCELEKHTLNIRSEITTLLMSGDVSNEFISINWPALKNWAKSSTNE